MQKDIKIDLEPGTLKPLFNNRWVQKHHKAGPFEINFVAIEHNEAVYRINFKGKKAAGTRRLKRLAKAANKSLRTYVRDVLLFEETPNHPVYRAAQEWAQMKKLSLVED